MSYPSSQESAGSTSDLNGPECESSDNAKPTQDAEPSSPDIGPVSPATKTLPGSMPDGSQVMAFNWQTGGHFRPGYSQNETQALHKGQTPAIMAFTQNQRDEVREVEVPGALAAEPGMKQQTYLFISSVEASPAKTSPSPESEPALPGKDQDSSMKQHESQTLFSGMEDGSSLRTYPDYFQATEDATSPSYSRRWPTSGFTTSPGEHWTADTSECPSGGGEYSSLPDVLEATVPERFYLSQKAAAGILRRAEKRGKELPPALDRALRELSADATGATNLTDTEPMSEAAA